MGLDKQVVDAEQLIVKHLDLWTSAQTVKSTAGRGSNNKIELTGIKKLRELILELAVRGKLVPQDPNDEPASELLKRIEVVNVDLLHQGKRKKKDFASLTIENKNLFDVPCGWSTVKLGEIADIKGGKRLPSGHIFSDQVTPYVYIRVTDMKNGTVNKDNLVYIDEETRRQIKKYTISSNDLYITIAGTIGEVGEIPIELDDMNLTENAAKIVFTYISKSWLVKILRSAFIQNQFTENTNQLAQPKLALHRIESCMIYLPPILEQKRISDKIEELMVLCDQLEQQSYQSIDAHNQLVDTLLQTLVDSTNADELASNWQRLSEHFDTLFTTEYSIDALKQTILQLAVMGKLVKQDPTDEPASELLKRIDKEKEALVKAGKIKKQKPLPPITDDEKPFELPEGWEWCRISNLALSCDYGTSQKSYESDDGIPVISMGQIQAGGVLTANLKRVPHDTPDIDDLFLKNGDLLYNRTNSAELVGKTGMFSGSDDLYTYASYLIRIRLPTNLVSPYYLNAVMNSPKFRELEINPHVKQQCGQANVNGTIMQSMRIPLPPYAEQLSVIAKIEELIDLSNQFMEQLSLNKELLNNLTSALLRHELS